MLWWIHTVHLITKLISKLHILFTAFDKTPEDMKLEIKINANRGCLWTHTVIQFLQIKVRELSDHARSRQNDKLTSSCSQQKEKKGEFNDKPYMSQAFSKFKYLLWLLWLAWENRQNLQVRLHLKHSLRLTTQHHSRIHNIIEYMIS